MEIHIPVHQAEAEGSGLVLYIFWRYQILMQ